MTSENQNQIKTPPEASEAEKAPATLESVRSKIFDDETAKPEVVEYTFRGVTLEWRQPLIESLQRSEDDADRSNRNFMVTMIIDNSYLPGTEDKVFSVEDYDRLVKMPLNQEFRKVLTRITSALGLDAEVEEKVKN